MGQKILTDEVYKQYAEQIVSVLKNDEFYEQFKQRVEKGSSNFKLAKKRLIQDISIDWISTIEDVLPNLDTIVRNPRKFIVQEEDIVDVSLARSISTESVKFLAQHTNMISKVDKDGMVTPSKILNITKEESFEIYENRFIYTLLLKLKDFVTMRYDKIKKASATQDVLQLDCEARFNLPSKKVTMKTEYFAQLSFDEVMRLDPETLTKIERVAKIDRIITDFLSSSFAKSMRNSAPVRPPIMRTNVILKEPNFKKALTLWQFIETYNATGGFSTSDDVEDYEIESRGIENLRSMVTLNTMLFESLYQQHETDLNMEDKEFADVLRVGEMDFQKDELSRDEYAQKLDNKQENEEEEEKVEEVAPEENKNAERNIDLEQTPEQPEQEQKPKEHQPQVEEREKEVEKEIPVEVEVERPVEVERLKELPPKADQEEVDLEPDAQKFDQHLFDVRKLYKRPDGDKLKQEEINKVKDAIDRCMRSYRRIKQEEIDDREREERIRHRIAEMEKRAESFRKLRAVLEEKLQPTDDALVFFGMDPLSYERARIIAKKRDEQFKADRDKAIANYNRNEKLDLNDPNKEEIARQIDEMENARKNAEGEVVMPKGSDNASAEGEQKPKKPRKPKAPKPPVEKADEEPKEKAVVEEFNEAVPAEPAPEAPAPEAAPQEEAPKPAPKPRAKKATTSATPPKPKKPKNIVKVDESKVGVGDIHFKNSSNDPFGFNFGSKVNFNTETRENDEEEPEETVDSSAQAPETEAPQEVSETQEQGTPATSSENASEAQETPSAEASNETPETSSEASETPSEATEEPENGTEEPAKEVNEAPETSDEAPVAEEPKEPVAEENKPQEQVAENSGDAPKEESSEPQEAPAEPEPAEGGEKQE